MAKGVKKPRGRAATFLTVYTAAWLVGAGVLLLIHGVYHRSFAFLFDGLYQHFASYRFVCDYLSGLLTGNPARLGAFNYSLGLGSDILTLLNSYDFTDPVCWITALLPIGYEARYGAMLFAKLYLTGLSFGLYCREAEQEDGLVNALGAVAYTFSAATLCTFSRHPNFINWMYFFPLLMAGGERYWRKGKRGLLIAGVFLNLFVNYYTFYIDAVLFALYVVTRALCLAARREKGLRDALAEGLFTAGVCLLGVLLAAVLLLPTFHAFANSSRALTSSGYEGSMLHYNLKYYLQTLSCIFIAYADTSSYVCLGMSSICVPAMCLLFLRRDKNADLRASLILCAVMLCVPLAGKVLNGFGYVSNRWSFVIVFYALVALVRMFPEMQSATGWRKAVMLLVPLACAALYGLYCLRSRRLNLVNIGAILLLLAAMLPVLFSGRLDRRAWRGFAAALVFVYALYQCVFTFVPKGANYLSAFQPAGTVASEYEDHSAARATNLSDGFYRVEESEADANLTCWDGSHGTSLWWSGLPSDMMDYYMSFDLDSVLSNSALRGLDGRAQLLETASVRFFTMPSGNSEQAPWGYALREDASDDRYLVYENPNALPIGYVYPGCMLKGDYDALDALDRQQAQMQCAAVDAIPEGQKQIEPQFAVTPLKYETVGADGATIVDGGMHVDETYGSLRLKVDVPENSEIYVVLKGVYAKEKVNMTNLFARRTQGDWSVEKMARLFQDTYLWPVLRDRISFNLGSGAPGTNEIAIRCEAKCTLQWDALEIVAVPMDAYEAQARALTKTVLEDVRVGSDEVAGSATLAEPGMLQFSIPYSDGWKAWVDGAPAKLWKSNAMYMALPLEAGDHEILLRYRTPWLREGAAISLVTLAGLIAHAVVRRRRRAARDK